MNSWFEQLFGFREGEYDETRQRFVLDGEALRSTVNGRQFGVGRFSTPSLAELRAQAAGCRPGQLQVAHEVVGDVLELHALPENQGALFQVASQLNCLEFGAPTVVPEDGVTGYEGDHTQGPACSLAAAAATVFRNYMVDIGGERGQRRHRQLNTLDALQARLGQAGRLIDVINGYTSSDAPRLLALGEALAAHDRDDLMSHVKIGLHTHVEVTFATRFVEPTGPTFVSQAFCSALSCGYSQGGQELWAPIATLVLDAAYEATLLAAAIDAEHGRGSGKVWLTFLGGGVFRNDERWIASAILRALSRVRDRALDVRIAHFRTFRRELRAIA